VSQIAVTTCAEGIVVASESLVTYSRGDAWGHVQKVFPLGPRLVFAAVGNASLPDPRIDDRWPGLGAHMGTLTKGRDVTDAPISVAARIGEFITDVLRFLSDRPRGWEGLAVAMWHARYVIAGWGPGDGPGMATVWTATPAEAVEDTRVTTEEPGHIALGVFDEWPRRSRRHAAGPTPGPHEMLDLDAAERRAVRVVDLACERYPRHCGGPHQVVRITAQDGVQWVERPEGMDDGS
jgi:hypothetical protein